MNSQIILRQPNRIALILWTPRTRQREIVFIDIRIHCPNTIRRAAASQFHTAACCRMGMGRRVSRVLSMELVMMIVMIVGGLHWMVMEWTTLVATVATMMIRCLSFFQSADGCGGGWRGGGRGGRWWAGDEGSRRGCDLVEVVVGHVTVGRRWGISTEYRLEVSGRFHAKTVFVLSKFQCFDALDKNYDINDWQDANNEPWGGRGKLVFGSSLNLRDVNTTKQSYHITKDNPHLHTHTHTDLPQSSHTIKNIWAKREYGNCEEIYLQNARGRVKQYTLANIHTNPPTTTTRIYLLSLFCVSKYVSL